MALERRRLWWVVGAALALIGVAIARILGPHLPSAYQASIFAAGAAIGVLGVLVAPLGAGRRRSPGHPKPGQGIGRCRDDDRDPRISSTGTTSTRAG